MPSNRRRRRHPRPISWYYELHDPTVTIVSPEATSPPAPSKVSLDFQHKLEIRRRGTHVGTIVDIGSIVHSKDVDVFCDAQSSERVVKEMLLSTPSRWFSSPNWRVPMAVDIASSIFPRVHNIIRSTRQHVALVSFVLVVTKEVHVMRGGSGLPDYVLEVLDTNLAFQQSFEAAQVLVGSVRPAPPELLESLVTEECVAAEGDQTEDCMICLEELNGHADVKRLPCSHHFHGNCILRWFTEKDFCPLCRYTYVPVPPTE